jgi:hypothetical protein
VKQVYSYQEIGTLIDQGKQVAFTCHPEACVGAVQKDPDSDAVTVTLNLCIRDTCVGMVEDAYASMLAVLDAFDVDDLAKVWEVLEEQPFHVLASVNVLASITDKGISS